MCGFAGLLTLGYPDAERVRKMIDPLAHRGPDDHGVWTDEEAGIGLGHRRLSILDLSPLGHQPMRSSEGRFVIAFNGEIYNHADLRRLLEQGDCAPEGGWRGHSDTETLVQAIAAWGLERTLERAVGMFAFALWDRKARALSLVRDRFGEKPLYYGWAGRDFVFGSELKALRAHPSFANPVDRRALHQFASLTWIPAPLSIYRSVFKLQPGCILQVTAEAADRRRVDPPELECPQDALNLTRYWSYAEVVRRGLGQPIASETEALDQLEQVLAAAIQGQAVADVPVGAFLSGGIDSSTIVALYQKYSRQPVRTYSIGFEEAGYNEAEDAARVAAHLGTVHHEHYVGVGEARNVIPLLPSMYDEPFADSSQIPTYLVSRFAKRDVTVALTGDGGDELFAGYNRHFAAPQLWKQVQSIPRPMRSLTSSTLGRLPSRFWSSAAGLLPGRRQPHVGAKLQKALRVTGSARSFDDVYDLFLDEWAFEPSPVLGADPERSVGQRLPEGTPDTVQVMYRDATGYLPGDILCKVDRASMAVSLETRVPFLDHRVAELAARIPLRFKVQDGQGKHILRKLLYRQAPAALFERPKAGFAVPVGEWIKGPLRPWAEDLLDPVRLAADGYFDPAIVRRRWDDHLSGRRDSAPALWAVLMFQAWLREQSTTLAAAA